MLQDFVPGNALPLMQDWQVTRSHASSPSGSTLVGRGLQQLAPQASNQGPVTQQQGDSLADDASCARFRQPTPRPISGFVWHSLPEAGRAGEDLPLQARLVQLLKGLRTSPCQTESGLHYHSYEVATEDYHSMVVMRRGRLHNKDLPSLPESPRKLGT